jgi:hypothetical protein
MIIHWQQAANDDGSKRIIRDYAYIKNKRCKRSIVSLGGLEPEEAPLRKMRLI